MYDYSDRTKPLAQDFKVIYHNEKEGYYVEGSGMVNMGDNTFVAVVPVVVRSSEHDKAGLAKLRPTTSVSHILRSKDGGESWDEVSQLPYYSAIPWVYDNTLYVFANKGGTEFRNDDLVLLKSEDKGTTWSQPVVLFEGHFWNAHTGMAFFNNKLYYATDDLSYGEYRGPRVVVCDLEKDIMDKASWRISNPVPFPGAPDSLKNENLDTHRNSMYLEPNVVCINNKIRVLVTTKIYGQSSTGICSVLDVEDDGVTVSASFNSFHAFPGGQLKFFVMYDDVSGLYWAAVNLPVDGDDVFRWDTDEEDKSVKQTKRYFFSGNDRRILMLMYSLDALNWFQAGCIAKADMLRKSFMYPALAVDNDDLCVIARTSINAPNRHDADNATFHRIKDFRKLAMDLIPENEK